jgi:hypothetical protein
MKNETTNAPDAYRSNASDIARLIDVLQMELDKHAAAAKADPKNWGRVGDLGKIRSDLIEMVSFMSRMDREAVEGFLAE